MTMILAPTLEQSEAVTTLAAALAPSATSPVR